MKKLSRDQKVIFGEFLSNFALAWLSFGLIGPVFSKIEDITSFMIKLTISIVISLGLLSSSINLAK